ncbi:MAG: hypothetical protein QXY89_04265 [Zestosphaera sp.]
MSELKHNPVLLFFLASSLTLVPGAAIVSYVAYELLIGGVKHHVWAVIGVTVSGAGFISLLMAVLRSTRRGSSTESSES